MSTATREAEVSGAARDMVIWADRLILGTSRHWLFVLNTLLSIFVTLPVLAPILLAAGFNEPANAIYAAYSLVCHQMPSRSYFIFGHQVAYCQRNFAIYTSIFLAGLGYIFVRDRLRPLPLWAYLLLIAPMAVDGTTQLFGWRLSNWWLRGITGTLFGVASVWLAFPYLEIGFKDIRQQAERQLGKVGVGGSTGAD